MINNHFSDIFWRLSDTPANSIWMTEDWTIEEPRRGWYFNGFDLRSPSQTIYRMWEGNSGAWFISNRKKSNHLPHMGILVLRRNIIEAFEFCFEYEDTWRSETLNDIDPKMR